VNGVWFENNCQWHAVNCNYRDVRSWTQTLTPPLFDWIFCPMDNY